MSGAPGHGRRSGSRSTARVAAALAALGVEARIEELPASTRTAPEAAAAVGCELGQIAKSLIFRGADTGRPVLVIASGANRVDEAKVAALLGEALARADADFVRARTGFAIGGVPPVGHAEPLVTFVDRDLLAWPRIWAAAGTPRALFALDPGVLERITGGTVADLRVEDTPG